MRGFLLGLSSGTICLAYCAPVVVPYLLGEGRSVKSNYWILAQFLIGRLVGYLMFAILAWALGYYLTPYKLFREMILGTSYIILAGFLIYYCFKKPKGLCAAEFFKGFLGKFFAFHSMVPLILGFLTGLNLCPPFLLAFTSAVSAANLLSALVFFSTFFLGTMVFFVPIPFLGALKQNQVSQWVGKMAAGIIGAYYFLTGILILIGGMKS